MLAKPQQTIAILVVVLVLVIGYNKFSDQSNRIAGLEGSLRVIESSLADQASTSRALSIDLAELNNYTANLEEKLTGERVLFEQKLANEKSALESQLAEERRQRELLALQQEADKVLQEAKISEQEQQLSQAQEQIEELTDDLSSVVDVASVVSEWEERVVQVLCEFGSFNQTGSGLLLMRQSGGVEKPTVMTNKHVIISESGKSPVRCRTTLPDRGLTFDSVTTDGEIEIGRGNLDFGLLTINTPNATLNRRAREAYSVCSNQIATGESVVILGYPSIGAANEITATEGIISGYEDDYYITSAKVEQGNSGGAAVALADNCYLGLPTFVVGGKVESLARILDVRAIGIE